MNQVNCIWDYRNISCSASENLLPTVILKNYVSMLALLIPHLPKFISKKFQQVESFTIPSSTSKVFNNILKTFVNPALQLDISQKFEKMIFHELYLLQIRIMNSVIPWYVSALQCLFYFIVFFVSFFFLLFILFPVDSTAT